MPDTSAASHADGALTLGGDPDKVTDYYRDWAGEYDRDMVSEGYTSPIIIAGLAALVTPVEADATALDAGCGTGLVGRTLRQRRPGVRITGVDLSQEMAEVAQQSGAYDVVEGGVDLMAYAADPSSPRFPLVLCSGTLTLGHIGIEGVDALLGLTESGGHLAFSVRRSHSLEEGYRGKITSLRDRGAVDVVSELYNAPYLENGGADYWLLRKTG